MFSVLMFCEAFNINSTTSQHISFIASVLFLLSLFNNVPYFVSFFFVELKWLLIRRLLKKNYIGKNTKEIGVEIE